MRFPSGTTHSPKDPWNRLMVGEWGPKNRNPAGLNVNASARQGLDIVLTNGGRWGTLRPKRRSEGGTQLDGEEGNSEDVGGSMHDKRKVGRDY